MPQIIPTVFAISKKEFNERFNKLIKISKNIQIDFMDGKFVKAESISLNDIPNLKKHKNNFEAHLMVKNPKKYIKKLKSKGFKKIIFHYEALKNSKEIFDIIKLIKRNKLIKYIAINPETKLEKITSFLPEIEGVLIMGVYPGKEHQNFVKKVYNKIKALRKINKKIKIQVDGGINPNVIKSLAKLNINYINSGSFISNSKNPKQALRKLNKIIQKFNIT